MTTVLDFYSEEEQTNDRILQDVHPSDSGGYSASGQSFTTPSNIYALHSCKFLLLKTGLPVGNLVAQLFAHTGTYGAGAVGGSEPTGAALAESDPVTMESLGTEYALITFSFSGAQKIELDADTYYCIAVVVKDAETLDITNYIRMGYDGALPDHDGNDFYYIVTTEWNPTQDDTPFYVYGEETGRTHSEMEGLSASTPSDRVKPQLVTLG